MPLECPTHQDLLPVLQQIQSTQYILAHPMEKKRRLSLPGQATTQE